ncbi:hypothetical protein E3P81_02387 [Wallemia ichthyophaga]|nr:hypothetical protein E3P97_02428 [Wallemia ichthyophaga]TIB31853.1 hypothetical protein E3P85_02078 [Wallemia ichthyophaga]TIB46168.1 hypothetical protein E3P82_02354 [Wallemia ichthyophaga]TIB49866.1 hypothetical protein E3P81_02387 [Wallemia ichthyophaga]TIB52940.1 hypothetical protein E3P80_02355 [Wallemia ichthyophaga]
MSNSFAKILQRSKFASYDPAIAQTYTASRAQRQRGEYGFKRGVIGGESIRVKSQDNELGAVDYSNTTGDAKVVQRISDMRVPVHGVSSAVAPYSSYSDSNSSSSAPPSAKHTHDNPDSPLASLSTRPDIEAMSADEFRRYVARLHERRPAFRSFLGKLAGERAAAVAAMRGQKSEGGQDGKLNTHTPVDLYAAAQTDAYTYQQFLKQEQRKRVDEQRGQVLVSNMHANGGLRYSHPSPIESARFTPPLPGRILPHSPTTRNFANRQKKPIALAGLVATTDMSNLHNMSATDFAGAKDSTSARRDEKAGTANFRVVEKASVGKVPRVVHNHSGKNTLEGAFIHLDVVEAGSLEKMHHFATAFPIGSPEYVSTFEKDKPSGRSRPTGFLVGAQDLPLYQKKRMNRDGENATRISEMMKAARGSTFSAASGWISILSWFVVYSPQIYENYVLQSASGLSLTFVVIWLLGDITNLVGGFMVHLLPPMLILALYYTACDVILLWQMWIYRGNNGISEGGIGSGSEEGVAPTHPTESDRLLSVQEQHRHQQQESHQLFVNLLCTALVVFGGALSFILNADKEYMGTPPLHSTPTAQFAGWTSAVLYILSRFPQIIKNTHTHCDGLSIPLFAFALCGNCSYVAQVLFESTDGDYLWINMSWLVGTIGTVLLDLVVLSQFAYYRYRDSCLKQETDEAD